jgi:hypothetical protein
MNATNYEDMSKSAFISIYTIQAILSVTGIIANVLVLIGSVEC